MAEATFIATFYIADVHSYTLRSILKNVPSGAKLSTFHLQQLNWTSEVVGGSNLELKLI